MRAISKWRHLMSSTVQIAPRTGKDGFGKPTYGTAVRYRAHLSRQPKLVRTGTAQVVDSNQSIYLEGKVAVQPTDQVTLSTGDVGSTESVLLHPLILSVEQRFDEKGPHHTVVLLG